MVPCITRMPAACDAAMPIARRMASSSRPSSFPAATAAPRPRGDAGLRPGDGAARRGDRQCHADAADRFDTERKGGEEISPADRPLLRHRQRRGGHRPAGCTTAAAWVSSNECMLEARQLIRRRMQRIGFWPAPDQRRRGWAGELTERRVDRIDHLMPRAAQHAAEDVEEGAPRLDAHHGRHGLQPGAQDVAREATGGIGGREIGCHVVSLAGCLRMSGRHDVVSLASQRAVFAAVDVDQRALHEGRPCPRRGRRPRRRSRPAGQTGRAARRKQIRRARRPV